MFTMFTLLPLVSIFLVVGAVPLAVDQPDVDWESFKIQFNKNYTSTQEELLRKQIFLENKKEVLKHNEDFKKRLTTYTMRINNYSDMLPQELEELHPPIMKMKDLFARYRPASSFYRRRVYHRDLPKSVDWRLKGAVTSVKSQDTCGACWAFSAVGSLEGLLFLKTGTLKSLSPQNLIDCADFRYGANGCEGGSLPPAFQYFLSQGLESESSYPYESKEDGCRFNESNVAIRIDDYRHVDEGDESQLMAAVATEGPISVCIDVRPSFHNYYGGVYHDDSCSNHISRHCVLAVGYGTTDDGQDYWLVKNSWGTSFGEDGYIRMARNRKNMCAIATYAFYPILSGK